MNNKKVVRVSRWALTSYIIAGLLAVYAISSIISALQYLREYFTAYNTSLMSNFGDAINYILQSSVTPLCLGFLVFMAGYLLQAVRSLKPENYIPETESNWYRFKMFFKKIFKSKKTVTVKKSEEDKTIESLDNQETK